MLIANSSSYPPVGQTWLFDLGVARIEHHYGSEQSMHYKILSGRHRPREEETVAIQVSAFGPGLFMVSWQECDGTTVVHIEDYNTSRFSSCVIVKGAPPMHMSGTMTYVL